MAAMARGWESKSVEEQQAQAAEGGSRPMRPLTPEEIAHKREREGLLLSRTRVLQQLQAAHHPSHRKMLEDALAELESRLARLG